MSQGNWKKDRAGKYVRFRRVNTETSPEKPSKWTLYIDVVARVGNSWRFSTGAKGKDKKGNGVDYKTRMAATSALDSYIERLQQQQPDFSDPEVEITEKCDGCGGSGIWHGAGYMLNGVFQGPSGKCFRCDGKGYQTDADVKRNSNYDNYIRRIEA